MDVARLIRPIVQWGVFTCSITLFACDSGTVLMDPDPQSNTDTHIGAQAIDGYIVNGDVLCDDANGGRTAAAGRLICPEGTNLITVNGGWDVGFDETATTGGDLFTGSLQAPGDARYVTPVTTLASRMAMTDGVVDRAAYDDAIALIKNRLQLQTLDITSNPAANVELARLNVELNLLATQFAGNAADYTVAMDAISALFENNTSIDMSDGVSLTSALNQQLATSAPHLALSPTNEISTGNKLDSTLTSIESAETIAQLENNVATINNAPAFYLDRTAPAVSMLSSYYYQSYSSSYYRTYERSFTFNEFLSPVSTGSGYSANIAGWDTDKMVFHSDAILPAQTVNRKSIDVAINIESRLDTRSLSAVIRGVEISMTEGDSRSIRLELPQNTMLNAEYTDMNGVVTQVTEVAEEDLFASSENGSFAVSIDEVRRQLSDYGYPNFLRQTGHYEMKLVIDGLNYELTDSDAVTAPDTFTVTAGSETVTGLGIQGYFTLN